MRLIDLDAKFLKRNADGSSQVEGVLLSEADGIIFLCPKCYVAKGSDVGVHSIICWFVGRVPDDLLPGPGRWNPSGTGIDDLTFVPPGNVSVSLESNPAGCRWHGHVKNGEAK